MPRWRCRCCGDWHDDLPFHYGAAAPAAWYELPEAERAARTELTSDVCLIDGTAGFLVGNLEIAVRGEADHFSWDVWVELPLADLARAHELWYTPGREAEPPYRGRLATALPGYPDTRGLAVRVQTREVGRRPRVELEPCDHPLAAEQRDGITLDRVQEIAETVEHG
jgi:hypothetical protein